VFQTRVFPFQFYSKELQFHYEIFHKIPFMGMDTARQFSNHFLIYFCTPQISTLVLNLNHLFITKLLFNNLKFLYFSVEVYSLLLSPNVSWTSFFRVIFFIFISIKRLTHYTIFSNTKKVFASKSSKDTMLTYQVKYP
jgi:hypothetical protein